MIHKTNGYRLLYMPDHHRAWSSGVVYEHIYLAEKYIGRELEETEVVHHEDRNRSNNAEENLFVFKTKDDHSRYHKTGIMERLPDGSYISPKNVEDRVCEHCGKNYDYVPNVSGYKYCSPSCSSLSSRRTDRPSSEQLSDLIKTKSFVEIGKDYGVSDNAVRKWCKSYNLPYKKKDIKNM